MREFFVVVFLLCFSFSTFSQRNADRIYVHTDRQQYRPLQTVWFKAYLYLQYAPNDITSAVEAELTDDKGNIVQHKRMAVIDGTAPGHFDLPADLTSGLYYLRAWRSVDTAVQTYTPLLIRGTQGLLLPAAKYQISFAASSPVLIPDVTNTVHYSITGNNKTTSPLQIDITDDAGKVVMQLNASAGSASSFELMPQKGKRYTALTRLNNGTVIKSLLPSVGTSGALINLQQNADELKIAVNIEGDKTDGAVLYAAMGNSVLLERKILQQNKLNLKLSTADLPEGVVEVYVKDQGKLLGSARSLVQRENEFDLKTIRNDSDSDAVYTLKFPEISGGSFSVAVTETNEAGGINRYNIKSALLSAYNVTGDITGSYDYINSFPAGTVVNNEQNEMVYDTGYLAFSGKLLNKRTGKPLSVPELTMYMQTKDSATNVILPEIDDKGNFHLAGMFFYDTARVDYKTSSSKDLMIVMDTIRSVRPVFAPPVFTLDYALAEKIKTEKNTAGVNELSGSDMNAVTVTTFKGTKKEQVNRRYASGMFVNSSMARVVDLINEPPVNNGSNIFDYLQGRIAGLLVTRINGNSYSLTSDRTISITGGASEIKLFLNQSEVMPEVLLGIRLKEIAMVKYFPPGYAPIPGIGGAGVLAVYTKKHEDLYNVTPSAFTGHVMLPGYGPVKDFSLQPNNSTLHWNPYVFINPTNKEYNFRLKNKGNVKIVVEGFTAEGDLIQYETLIGRNK